MSALTGRSWWQPGLGKQIKKWKWKNYERQTVKEGLGRYSGKIQIQNSDDRMTRECGGHWKTGEKEMILTSPGMRSLVQFSASFLILPLHLSFHATHWVPALCLALCEERNEEKDKRGKYVFASCLLSSLRNRICPYVWNTKHTVKDNITTVWTQKRRTSYWDFSPAEANLRCKYAKRIR